MNKKNNQKEAGVLSSLIATFFGIGKLPSWISYALASLAAVPVTYLLFWASVFILTRVVGEAIPEVLYQLSRPGLGILVLIITQGVAILILALLSVVAAKAAGAYAKQIGSKDPAAVVVDEVLGQALCFILIIPQTQLVLGTGWLFVSALIMNIVLFRVFDWWKPWPIYKLEKIKGSAGIVLDDLAAGVASAVVYYLLGFGALWFVFK